MSIQTEQQTHSLLDAFVKVAPFLNSLIQDDITIGIYDTEKLIVNIPAKTFSLNVKLGRPAAKRGHHYRRDPHESEEDKHGAERAVRISADRQSDSASR